MAEGDALFHEIPAPAETGVWSLDEKDLDARALPLGRAETAVLAPRIATLAVLANNVYRRERPIILPGWREAIPPSDGKGLSYAVYVRPNRERPVEAVLAFRGTDDLRDWAQNLKLTSEQTEEAEAAFAQFAREYRRPGVAVSVTGHSLGGGLALRTSFLPNGAPATVFNWAPFWPPRASGPADPPRLCVWEKHEILEFVRKKMEKPAVSWGGTRMIRVNFSHERTDRQHEMEPLARSLVKAAAPYDADLRAVAGSPR
jgi:hypothetical protein